MQRNIIIYSILLISLIGISLFLTSNFIDSEKNELTDPIVKNIFQADEVSLKVSFSDRTIDFSIKSQMLNSLADSDFMRLFNPEISFDNKKNLKILGISKTADFFYKSNVFKFNELVNFEGTFDNTKFKVHYLHYWKDNETFVENKINYSNGYIKRTPDNDERNKKKNQFGRLLVTSFVCDLIK